MTDQAATNPGSRWASLRSDFLEVDTRWLALQRIVLGLLLLAYLLNLMSQDRLVAFFTDEGALPIDVLRRLEPQHHAFTLFRFAHTTNEALAVFALEGLLGVLFTLGFGTRIVGPLALLGLISIHHRMPYVVNASMMTMHLLAIPWVVLPLGRHASVDAWIGRRRGIQLPPLRVRSLAPLVLRLQLFAVYYFNAVHKSGATWRTGEAVHYVLFGSHSAWPWTVWLRGHEPPWFSPLFTYAALVLELGLAIVLVLPARRHVCRRLAVAGMLTLHLGIAAMMDVGPFPFVFGAAALMLLAAEDGSMLDRLLRVDLPLSPGPSDRRSRQLTGAREAFLFAHLAVQLYLVWPANHAVQMVLGRPPMIEPAFRVANALYISQAWGMYAPDAPWADLLLMPVVELDDGRVLDVATRRQPSFEGLDTRYSEPDYILQIFESQMVSRMDGPWLEAYARYQAGRPRREAWGGEVRVRGVVVHQFLMTRPPRATRSPAFTRSTVVYEKRFLPVEQPGRTYL